jgi:putative restriction endonuclease
MTSRKEYGMTPLDRLRIEKAANDCGFEMTPLQVDDGLELRSARFPESLLVRSAGVARFKVTASSPLILDTNDGAGSLMVESYDGLYEVLRAAAAHARTLPSRVADTFRHETAGLPRSTESERVVVQRVGQNLFRAALLDYWQERCCVTGLGIPGLLRASHIKPWAVCDSDDERLDVFNGLLLAPHIDALLDGGWISFSDEGRILISDVLPTATMELLGVSPEWRIHKLKPAHKRYLDFHRTHELRRSA